MGMESEFQNNYQGPITISGPSLVTDHCSIKSREARWKEEERSCHVQVKVMNNNQERLHTHRGWRETPLTHMHHPLSPHSITRETEEIRLYACMHQSNSLLGPLVNEITSGRETNQVKVTFRSNSKVGQGKVHDLLQLVWLLVVDQTTLGLPALVHIYEPFRSECKQGVKEDEHSIIFYELPDQPKGESPCAANKA